ncbi:DUF6020 family protein [Bifidobacterium platyrrhinorum]|nr:DUF6020 family protein [Bifidobacterium platyrrhinorum]
MTFTDSVHRYSVWWLLSIVVCWLPWLIVCWPGVMRDDTIAQFMQSAGYHPYYVQHPLFDTLIFGLFWNIGFASHNLLLGIGLYVLVQASAFALDVSLTLCYLRKLGVARSVLATAFLFFAVCPAIVQAIPTMSKDTLHAVFLMPLAIVYVEICLTKGAVLSRAPVCVILIALIMMSSLSKRTATVVIVVSFVVLIVLAKRYRLITVMCLVIGLGLAQGVCEPVLEYATDAIDSPSMEAIGFVFQPVARIQSKTPERITLQERRELSGVLDLDKAGASYKNYRSDETSWAVNADSSISQKITGLKAWATIGLRNPGEYAKAYGNIMLDWFYPKQGVYYGWNSQRFFNKEYMRQWNTFVQPPMTAEEVLAPLRDNGHRPKAILRVAYIGQRISTDPKLNSQAYYATYMPLMLLIYGVTRKRWLTVAAGTLLGVNVMILYLSPISFPWYLLPVTFILPLFFGINTLRRIGNVEA